jgi:hypothetical protein
MTHATRQRLLDAELPDHVKLIITPEVLDEPVLTPDEIALHLRDVPLDGAIFWLSRAARIIEGLGELAPGTQAHLLRNACTPGRFQRRLADFVTRGFVFATRPSLVQLARLALAVGRRDERGLADGKPIPLTQAQRQLLVRQLLSINFHLLGGTAAHAEAGEPLATQKAKLRLAAFIGAELAGTAGSSDEHFYAWCFGALCANAAMRRSSALDGELERALGIGLIGLHGILQLTLAQFELRPDGRLVDAPMLPPREAAAAISPRLVVDSLTTREGFGSHALGAPQTAQPIDLRWRPLFQAGAYYVCWDYRALLQLVSFNFPEFIGLLCPTLIGRAADVWHGAIEDTLTDAVAACAPGAVVHRLPEGRERVAEWEIQVGRTIFVVEWKNLMLPERSFRAPNADYLDAWIRDKLVHGQGFAQVYATIDRMVRRLPGSDEAGRIAGVDHIWPVVLVPQRFPMENLFSEFLEDLTRERQSFLATQFRGLRPPLVLCVWDFLYLLSFGDSAPGLLGEWLTQVPRPMFLHAYLDERLPGAGSMKAFFEIGAGALEQGRARLAAAATGRAGTGPR